MLGALIFPHSAPHRRRRLIEANINKSAPQFRMASLGLGLDGALVAWVLFILGLPALMIGDILVYAPFKYPSEHALSRGLAIEKHLPLRIAAGLQAERGLDLCSEQSELRYKKAAHWQVN